MFEAVARALSEDIGGGDVTAALIPADRAARARVVVKEHGVLCGRPWFDRVFAALDPNVTVTWHIEDGTDVAPGDVACELAGNARILLTGERTALNFLQTLSGTATTTRRYAQALSGYDCDILDTRKTLPGMRLAQKYAVRTGGGSNHRFGLYDVVLIKENHIAAAGSIQNAVDRARQLWPGLKVEVEVENLDELGQVLAAQADTVMLDDFSLSDMTKGVALVQASDGARPTIEVSGNVTIERLPEIAATGVDFISSGALTKHVRALDLSMRMID
ncbi:MAG: carboxylating nicotinate-nucleotide diphosphorylase [Gammaproteobacteria bacterium]